MAAGFVIDRPDDRRFVHPVGRQRQVFADLNSGNVRLDRLEVTSNFEGRLGLQIPHVLRGGPAQEVQQDDTFGFAWNDLPHLFGAQKLGKTEPC